jgi:hypothetical protein
MDTPTPTGRAWDRYTPMQKVGAGVLFVVMMSIIAGLMYLKWRQRFGPTEAQTAAREYAELVPQARDLARTVRDVPTAQAAAPKLKPMLDRIRGLDAKIRQFRADPADRDDIDRELVDAKVSARDLEKELGRIQQEIPDAWRALTGPP